MPGQFCACQCKMCRLTGRSHCHSHPTCGAPTTTQQNRQSCYRARDVTSILRQLKAASGSHSPSVGQVERALPGLVQVDACFLSNPYATAEVLRRFRTIPDQALEKMFSHYPTQSTALAAGLAPHVGVAPGNLLLANGASEVIGALLATRPGPMVVSVPTFSAYYELARGPVIRHQLDHRDNFHVDLQELEALALAHHAETVVIINPNNPDGGLVQHRHWWSS
jgi:histidinol-phosphate/aromatic aminotransferase/cobyric acid decarboxylase-like protein